MSLFLPIFIKDFNLDIIADILLKGFIVKELEDFKAHSSIILLVNYISFL